MDSSSAAKSEVDGRFQLDDNASDYVSDDGDDRDTKLAGFGDSYVFFVGVEHEDCVGSFFEAAKTAQVALQLGEFAIKE